MLVTDQESDGANPSVMLTRDADCRSRTSDLPPALGRMGSGKIDNATARYLAGALFEK
jgi:hypothetical protein